VGQGAPGHGQADDDQQGTAPGPGPGGGSRAGHEEAHVGEGWSVVGPGANARSGPRA
jgi:hypothetical protein